MTSMTQTMTHAMRFAPPVQLWRRATALSLAAGLAIAAAAAQAQNMPAQQSAGTVQYSCGGIGVDESTAMRAAMKDYPLALLFAAPGGDYLADINVQITGAGEASFTAGGPVCLLKLPEGRYSVKATTKDGREKSQSVEVGKGSKSLDFRF